LDMSVPSFADLAGRVNDLLRVKKNDDDDFDNYGISLTRSASIALGAGRSLCLSHKNEDNEEAKAELTIFNEEFKDKSSLKIVQDLCSQIYTFETTFALPDLGGEDQITLETAFDPKKPSFDAEKTKISVEYSTEKYPISLSSEVSAEEMTLSGVLQQGKLALGLQTGLKFDEEAKLTDNLEVTVQYEDDDQSVALELEKFSELRIGMTRTVKDNIEVAGQVTLEDLKTPKVAVAAKFPNERVGEIITHVHQDEGLKVQVGPLRPLAFMAARMSVDLGWGSQCRLGFDLALNEAE